jgi:uncharacterized protein (DUF924 family)
MSADHAEVLAFWFGSTDEVDKRWFNGGAAFDALIRERFGTTVQAALDRAFDAAWPARGAAGTLALIVVLDQFTRNLHRGTPLAFAGDARALALAQQLQASGQDRELGLLQRWFAAMPFEHAEDMAQQDTALRVFEQLNRDAAGTLHAAAMAGALDYAQRHADVVRRFGRFPHRNAILGRDSTAEERAFLQQPGSSF